MQTYLRGSFFMDCGQGKLELKLSHLIGFLMKYRGNRLLKFFDRYLGVPLVAAVSICGRRRQRAVRKVLVVDLSVIGDTVLQEPAFRALRKGFSKAEIDCICAPENAFLIRRYQKVWGYFDRVRVVEARELVMPQRFMHLVRWLRGSGYDVAIDFGQWTRVSALLAVVSGAPMRVGFRTAGQLRTSAFTHPVKHRRNRHQRDAFCDLVEALGVRVDRDLPRFPLVREDHEEAAHLLRKIGVYDDFVVLHPCAGRPTPKEWPLQRYAELSRRLCSLGKDVVVTGTNGDRKRIEEYDFGEARIIAGETSVGGVAAVFAAARVVVCNDCGAMHIACAAGTPVVALCGPANPREWGPLHPEAVVIQSDAPCAPCLYLGFEFACRHPTCMETIAVHTVLRACLFS